MIEFKNLSGRKINIAIFKKIFKKALGERLELSIVIAPPLLMRKLNAEYRNKKGAANVLAFYLEKGLGEIFLNSRERDLPKLFTHACLHLKGYDHKSAKTNKIMTNAENKILKSVQK